MLADHISAFVKARLDMLPTKFTLNGETVSSHDLSDPSGLLPLLLVKTGKTIEILDTTTKNDNIPASIIQPADPSTHMLSSTIGKLPDMPVGMLHLYINSAILSIARPPSDELHLPHDLSEASLPQSSELSLHIAQHPELRMSPMASQEHSGSLDLR